MKYVKTTEEALEFIAEEHAKLTAKLDDTIPAIRKLESYPKLPQLFTCSLSQVDNTGSYYSGSGWSYHKPHECKTVEAVEKRCAALLAICDTAPALLEEVRLKNVEIVEHNKRVVDKIKMFMSTVGIPATYSAADPKSRARYPKSITHNAGYIQDIRRTISTADQSYKVLTDSIARKRAEITKWATDAIRSIVETEKAAKANEAKKRQEKALAVLKVKYNLDFEADAQDVLDHILESNKYLRLADAMISARNDFSEHYRVEYALGSFSVENDVDMSIEKEISRLCEDYEGDGRIFRDCEWNYGAVMSYAPADLITDYNTLVEIVGER